MKRYAAHRNGFSIGASSGCQRYIQQRRGLFGVIIEEFVKVSHTVEQQIIGMFRFDAEILLHHRCLLRTAAGQGFDSSTTGLQMELLAGLWWSLTASIWIVAAELVVSGGNSTSFQLECRLHRRSLEEPGPGQASCSRCGAKKVVGVLTKL